MTDDPRKHRLSELTLQAIQAEFDRAVAKHDGRTPKNPHVSNGERLAVLGEEFGEVCRAVTYDEGSYENLVKELIQVAAMAAAWAEYAMTQRDLVNGGGIGAPVDGIAAGDNPGAPTDVNGTVDWDAMEYGVTYADPNTGQLYIKIYKDGAELRGPVE